MLNSACGHCLISAARSCTSCCADVALVGPRMDGDAVRARFQRDRRSARDARECRAWRVLRSSATLFRLTDSAVAPRRGIESGGEQWVHRSACQRSRFCSVEHHLARAQHWRAADDSEAGAQHRLELGQARARTPAAAPARLPCVERSLQADQRRCRAWPASPRARDGDASFGEQRVARVPRRAPRQRRASPGSRSGSRPISLQQRHLEGAQRRLRLRLVVAAPARAVSAHRRRTARRCGSSRASSFISSSLR